MPNRPDKIAVPDKAWLLSLRDQACIFCGRRGDENESVVAAHLGTHGKGIKTADEALPVCNTHHQEMHRGEITALRRLAPDWLILAAFRAYARQLYADREKPRGWAEELMG
jgi:hypothetical protein